jgi:Domain of unknown function (DUF1929)/Legume lectin domain/PKD domain/Glyoxal oxidase N-terminus
MQSIWNRLFTIGFLFLIAGALGFAPTARSQANIQGQWQTLSYTMPINPVHAALLPNGKVLIVSGSGNVPSNTDFEAAILDTVAGTVTKQAVTWDMFCNGMVVLPDGRPFIVGGTLQYDPFFGQPRSSIFDPSTGTFSDQQNMADGRWYPTATVLADGRVMVFGGTNKTGGTNTAVEIFTVGSGWSTAHNAPFTPPLYPRMHVLPSGKVFYSGSTTTSSIFDPSNFTWTINVAVTNYGGTRTYGSSVLLPLTPGNAYKPRVLILGGGNPATATTEVIDLSAATPKWVKGPNMSAQRIEMNATLLPNGKVLALGGSFNDEDLTTAALNADIYDPNANTMSSAGTEAFARLYHSVSLLMSDGRVLVAGGNPKRGTYEPHMEIYTPAYLFNSSGALATRPTITSLSTSVVGYGNSFTLQTPDAANISTVVMMRNGSVTHAFNMDQRYVGVTFTQGSGVLTVTAPPSGNIAPPGYYMLFLINSTGVPSVAQMVQLSLAATDKPPTGTITSPASDPTIAAGGTVSYAGSGNDSDGTIKNYFWNFGGGTPSTSNVANPGTVTYPTAGTYTTTFTVTDNQGIADQHPPTRTVTVTGPANFTVGVSPSLQSVTQGGALPYSTTIAAVNGFTGTVGLSVSGLPSGTTASFNPASVSGGGSSTLTVTTASATPTGVYTLAITGTSGTLTHTVATALIVSQSGGMTAINFGSGFSGAGLQFNGHSSLNETRLQLTDTISTSEASSAFWTTPVNVQNFNNIFTFQLLNPNADGFTFTIQNAGTTALGSPGGGLGYGKFSPGTALILKSVAVKFDLYSNSGEGTNSTGLYTNGATPTTPATTMTGGVNIHNGDIFLVQMSYDGTTLTMTITDTVTPANTFTTSFPINIPSTVGGNTAFVGFTAGTGGQTSTQDILAWTYGTSANSDFSLDMSPTAQSVVQGGTTPYTAAVTPIGGFTGTVGLSVSGLPTGATAAFVPTSITGGSGSSTMTVSTGASTPAGTYPLTVTAVNGTLTHTSPVSLIVTQSTGASTINFGEGFTATGLQFNGHTKLNGTRLQLTDTTSTNQAASAFWTTPVNVQSFTNTFMFQLTNPTADGFTFTIQNAGITALGSIGAGLGYGKFSTLTALIPKSVAVKFDLFSNSGEGTNSIGIYTNGVSPTLPATTLGGGVNLHSGDIFQVQMTYDGTALTMTITDATVPTDTFTTSFPINIPATVGGNTALVGFTGGTGGATAMQEILTWNYNSTTSATPDFSIGVTPASQSVVQGANTPYTATVSPTNGFAGAVALAASGLPTGATAVFAPTSITGGTGSSTMTVSTITSTPVGTYPATVTATSGTLTHTGSVSLVVTLAASPDFSIGVTPASQSVVQGASTPYTATVTPTNGFTGTVALAATGLPTGATVAFAPTSITGGSGSSTMTVSAIASTPVGTYPVTVTATSGTLTHTLATSLTVTQSGGGASAVNFGSGFTATGMQFNGHTKLNGTRLQLTDATATNEAASAFWTTPVNVQTFTNNFAFQLTNPNADGFTFTIQNMGPTALGSSGSSLGYSSPVAGGTVITSSVAVKFDIFDSDGEGPNSIGLYTNGATPTIPATTLGGGVNLHSGNIFNVQMSYNGTNLIVTLTDATVPADTFTTSFPINIPATVGGNTALVGFTAGTGGATAMQEILTWNYNSTTSATPDFSIGVTPASQSVAQGASTPYTATVSAIGGFTGTVSLGMSGLPIGAAVVFNPTTITNSGSSTMTISTATTTSTGSYPLTVTATSGTLTHTATATLVVNPSGGTAAVNFGAGFSAGGLQFNGHTTLNGTRLQLTDKTTTNQAASAFWTTPVNVQSFSNTFTLQLTNPNADGFTFTIQNSAITALGSVGAGLGYGKYSTLTALIPKSVAVKFDLFSNAGEGTNSTGIYTNGASPTVPATTLTGGIDLHSGDVFQVQMTYNGTTLSMTINDLTNPVNTFSTSFPINIPATVGANTALVGFTAGTGGVTATQEILSWTYATP